MVICLLIYYLIWMTVIQSSEFSTKIIIYGLVIFFDEFWAKMDFI